VALALIYFLSIGVVALYFWVSRGTWNKLIALSSFSTQRLQYALCGVFLSDSQFGRNNAVCLLHVSEGNKLISLTLVVLGLILTFYGTVGILVCHSLQKLHYMGISDTLGSVLIILGIMMEWKQATAMLSAAIVLLLILGPIVSHIIARGMINRVKR